MNEELYYKVKGNCIKVGTVNTIDLTPIEVVAVNDSIVVLNGVQRLPYLGDNEM